MKAEIELEHQAREAPLKIAHTDKNVIEILTGKLHTIFSNVAPQREVVVVCIGTDRSTGDSLGPLVGSYLQKKFSACVPHLRYGGSSRPCHQSGRNAERNLPRFPSAVHRRCGRLPRTAFQRRLHSGRIWPRQTGRGRQQAAASGRRHPRHRYRQRGRFHGILCAAEHAVESGHENGRNHLAIALFVIAFQQPEPQPDFNDRLIASFSSGVNG